MFGSCETIPSDDSHDENIEQRNSDSGANGTTSRTPARHTGPVGKLLAVLEPVTSRLQACPKHHLCRHQHGCVYYVIQVRTGDVREGEL